MSDVATDTSEAAGWLEEVWREAAEAEAKLITEDDEPADSPFSEKQQRFLTETLYSSWTPPPHPARPDKPRTFWAAANVGIFPLLRQQTPRVPDVFVSLYVSPPERWHENKTYFLWDYGKAPDVVIEIVSNREGGELGAKLYDYAELGVIYYVVHDPTRQLGDEVLQTFVLQGGEYRPLERAFLPRLGLGLTLWHGVFEQKEDTYLRWCDEAGELLLTGDERAAREAEARRQAEERAAQAEERAARFAAKLRELGLDPEQL
jgi:Uma2 family endonuclease